ncbi:hypothetical protein ACROYT_G012548 [Oculina patagonica]
MESEFVWVSKDFKPHVIGKGGYVIQDIKERSGAAISSASTEEEGFTVSGDAEQIASAKKLILEKVEEIKRGTWELVDIPDGYKGLIIGKGGAKLREISNQTGAEVIRKSGEVYIISGTEHQREKAKVLIRIRVAVGRLRGVENVIKYCCFIDGWNLSENCRLKLEQEDHVVVQGLHTQYRLKPTEESELQESFISDNDPSYLVELARAALESLRMLKREREDNDYLEADMWCHFGTAIIRAPDEEKAAEGAWSIEEATAKFQRTAEGSYWRAEIKEGVDFVEDIFKGKNYEETPGEYTEYVARYDLTYVSPCCFETRCKVWVAKENAKLEDIPIPFSDVKNILEEIHFEDELTRSRCRGWLVLPSRRYLQADILFPGCVFDCRLTIRGRTENAEASHYVPSEDVRRVLSRYLSGLILTKDDPFGLRLPEEEIPEGFHLIYKRSSKRTVYTTKPGFSIILSKESSWRGDVAEERSRESTDLHLHCKEWDKQLSSGRWEPKDILKKLPEFLQFVKEVQGLVVHEIKRKESTTKVPPEILARGTLALEAFNNALAEGESCVKRVPLMLIGQARSGKTSLKKSLMGIRFNPEEDSTVGIDVDRYDFKVTTETWVTGKKDEEAECDTAAILFEHHAARLVAGRLKKEESVTKRREAVDSARSFDSEITDMLMGTQLGESSGDPGPIDTPEDPAPTDIIDEPHLQARDTDKLSQENDVLISTKLPDFEDIAYITEKLLQHDVLEDEDDIYSIFWDFAGQSVYYETHPLFLTARAIYFLVYDLSQNPHDTAKPLVKQGVYTKIEDSFNPKKNVDYLDFWMTSVASLASEDENDDVETEGLVNSFPAVFLVCTHADKPHDGRDPRELAVEIFGSLKNKPYGPQLSDVFVVDNTKSGSEFECGEVTRLREAVLDVAKELPHINEVIPVKWLKYEKALQIARKGGHKCISLAQARHIASEVCDINDDNEILTLLNFLHDLRILIHFDDTPELNNVVVLDPQWLIDVFKKVITVRPYDSKEKKFLNLWCKLETEGILEETLLEHVWRPLIRDKVTSESLIAIMEKFSLLCPWPLSDASCIKQYLVPSMLKSHPPQAITKLVASAQIPSLFFKFDSGQVPPGLFPRLVLQFYQWGKEEFWRPESPKLYHGFARFHVSGDEDCSVILLCHSSSVEVVYHRGDSNAEIMEVSQQRMTLSTDFDTSSTDFNTASFDRTRALCRQLGLILECMRNQFCWLKNIRYKMGVICPVCCQGSAVEFCDTHRTGGCKEEECLHFWSESELCCASRNVICTRSASAQSVRVSATYCSAWFTSLGEQLRLGTHDGRLSTLEEANDENTLALPGAVQESLLSETSDCKEVVLQLKKSLYLDQASLKEPDVETKGLIRCFVRKARSSDRLDVVEHLREIVPAGTTGKFIADVERAQFINYSAKF